MKPNLSRVARPELTSDDQVRLPISQNREINRLLCAAVVNPVFRTRLLVNPSLAVAAGYHGDSFDLSAEEVALLQSIEANTLQEFAERLLVLESAPLDEGITPLTERQTIDRHSASVRVRL